MNIEVYTLEGCGPCQITKMYLDQKGYEYHETSIPNDLTREEFLDKFPDAEAFPHVLVDGNFVFDIILYLEGGL